MKLVKIDLIEEGYTPRKSFEGKEELKRSIEKDKLLDPLFVREVEKNHYTIIDGNRRFRVVKDLGWTSVECIVSDADEEESYHLSYIKNTHRENFNPIEESTYLQTVKDRLGYNNEDLVRKGYGRRSTIDDKLSLLTLPEYMQEKVTTGELRPSKGYVLATCKDKKSQRKLFEETVSGEGISNRTLKKKVRSLNVRRKREEEILSQPKIPDGEIPGVVLKDSSDMSELADSSAGLIVTSPPYGVGMEYEKGISFEDHLDILRRVFSECNRVLVSGGRICVIVGDIHNFGTRNGGKPEIQLIGHHIQEILRPLGILLVDIITWRKGLNWVNNPQVTYHQKTKHTSYRILINTEYILIFHKEGEREVPFDIEYESKISKDEWKKWVDGVWEIPPVRKQEGHPAQFPEEIPRRLIKMFSYNGDIVLDPFGGTMTTVKVANELGRVGIGYEKEEKYKPVIMEKLGIKEEDLKKPEPISDIPVDLVSQVSKAVEDIRKTEGRSDDRIAAIRLPIKDKISKDDLLIDWFEDKDDPDPSGSSPPQIKKADDYEDDLVSNESPLLLPERSSDIAPHLDKIVLGNCLDKLKDIPDNSVDLVATDPPYGLKFMGKDWDKAVPSIDIWKESLRVLKPGALAFIMCTPRQDCLSRMITNLEEAGFSLNFTPLYWTYAQGFPKAYNIVNGIERNRNTTVDSKTPEPKQFKGSYGGFQPKPAVEVIIVAMKPMDEKTYVGQALKNGKGITWIDDCRIPYRDTQDKSEYDKRCEVNGKYETGPTWSGKKVRDIPSAGRRTKDFFYNEGKHESWNPSDSGRFPANLLVSDDVLDDGKTYKSPTSFVRNTDSSKYSNFGFGLDKGQITFGYGDTGSYSRYFSLDAWAQKNLPFLIVSKASKKEKNAGLGHCKTFVKNTHPTVKPIKLMSYLITMGSREGEIVLDVFSGSGTTCVAAKMLNRKFIGFELNEEYHKIAEERVNNVALSKAA